MLNGLTKLAKTANDYFRGMCRGDMLSDKAVLQCEDAGGSPLPNTAPDVDWCQGHGELVLACYRRREGDALELRQPLGGSQMLICAEGCTALGIPHGPADFSIVLRRSEFPGARAVDCRWKRMFEGAGLIFIDRVVLPASGQKFRLAFTSWEAACRLLLGKDACVAGAVTRVWVGTRKDS